MKNLLMIAITWLIIFGTSSVFATDSSVDRTSAYGKYSNIIQELTCHHDKRKYGNYRDYGYWNGGAWCGQTGKTGYWVWNAPTWYVWQTQN